MILAVALYCTGAAVLRHHLLEKESAKSCRELDVRIEGESEFVSPDDIRHYIDNHCGALEGVCLDSIDLRGLEEMLDSKSAILKSQAWHTPDSVLHISVIQRRPAARFQKGKEGFYVDDNGFIFPLHPDYTAPVPVVTGHIPVRVGGSGRGEAGTQAEREWIAAVLQTLREMGASRLWKDSFPDISVDARQNLILEPKDAAEKIVLGRPDHIKDKLSRIRTYYSNIKPAKPEGWYTTINVKYDGQIICRR